MLDPAATAAAPESLVAENTGITTAAAAGLVDATEHTTPFDYLFDGLAEIWPAAHLSNDDPAATVAALKALGSAMVEDQLPADPLTQPENSIIPPVYTYWGQFIDHDMTANTDRENPGISDINATPFIPRDPDFVRAHLGNLRHPALNLDSLYGDGPTFDPSAPTTAARQYNGIKFLVGPISLTRTDDPTKPIPGDQVAPAGDLEHDLPRDDIPAAGDDPEKIGVARIADGRNDENLIIAQLHTAFLRFHNNVVDWVTANEPEYAGDAAVFARARQLVQYHYQWLVINDFLATVTATGIADQVLYSDEHLFDPECDDVYMPLEYSVAAYRFGHSMVRGAYDYNRNFGRPGKVIPNASFSLLFKFTGKASPPFIGQTHTLPFNWVIEWDNFVDKGSPVADHFARKIDTRLAPALRDLNNEGVGAPPIVQQIQKRLAVRNLLRGYLLGIPTGQKIAEKLGIAPLTAAELQQGNSAGINDALAQGGFLENTPLWYYVLKEAEVRANGNSLGELGSRIVCETIIGQIRIDPDSYLHVAGGWTPHDGVKLPDGDPIVSIGDLLRFAKVLA